MQAHLQEIADTLVLGALLEELRARYGRYELVEHWKQGEFHHDVVVRVHDRVFVVATNCNGGVKEVLAFESVPDRWALWHWRCPHVADFYGELPPLLGRAVTPHWFDPCDLLRADARSELREEHRERQHGGGWQMVEASKGACGSGTASPRSSNKRGSSATSPSTREGALDSACQRREQTVPSPGRTVPKAKQADPSKG